MTAQQATNKKTATVSAMAAKGDGAGRAVSPKEYTQFDNFELPEDLLSALSEEALAEYLPDDEQPQSITQPIRPKHATAASTVNGSNGHKPPQTANRVMSADDILSGGNGSRPPRPCPTFSMSGLSILGGRGEAG